MGRKDICKVWCSVYQLRLKSVEISCFKQLTLSKWPMYQSPNLPVSTVPSFYTTMTSISPLRKLPRSSVLPKSTWKPSGLDSLQGRNIGDLICNVGSAGGGGGAAAAGGGGGASAPAADGGDAAAPAEEKKEEKKDDSDSGSGSSDDMGFGLFD